ncbi:winged helix-turn-helix domain-containing protein [Bacillus sp. JJ1521]|uniref:winged helix-turn-helix domain-containing protein n=1 Tax=Bacillus sp. JJ1521 TaxID=3122957 RepID=UPI002FFF0437
MNEPLEVSVEQSKLLGNALRVQIIRVLTEEPKTSKQVADLLGHSPGNVHYHIRKLYEGGLIDLVEEKQFGGVMEKYYKSKAKWFNSDSKETIDPALRDDFQSSNATTLSLRLKLTEEQQTELTNEFKIFLEKWVEKTSVNHEGMDSKEFSIGVKIVSTKPSGENK